MDKMTIKYKKIRKIIDALKERSVNSNPDVSFEYIMASCFPQALENIKLAMREQYTKGYIAGKEEKNNENDNLEQS